MGALVVCAAFVAPPAARRCEAAVDVVGYVPYGDQQNGFEQARDHGDVLGQVSPWWYTFDERSAIVRRDQTVRARR